MTSIQPDIPQINANKYEMDKEQPCTKKLLLLVQPTSSVFLSASHASTSNACSTINSGNSFSHPLRSVMTNVWVSSSNYTEPSLVDSQKTNLSMDTNNHKPITNNKLQQLLLPINHFIIAQRPNQTILKSKTHTDISLDLGKNETQQVGKVAFVKNYKNNETDGISKEKEPFCSICDMRFWTKELLNSHLEEKQFSCRICTSVFCTHSELESHFLSHPDYKCKQCKQMFSTRKDLYVHRRNVIVCNPKLECNICKKKYSTTKSLNQHKRSVHSIGEGEYKCVVCDSMYLLPIKLSQHQRRTHVAYEGLKCKLCNVLCLGPERLKFHMRLSHLKKRETCPKLCPVCGKVFYMDSTLTNHIHNNHNDRSEILCEFCGKACKGKRSMIQHISRNHKGLKNHKYVAKKPKSVPAVCEICGKTLKSKYQLGTHLQIHSNERRFKCDVCNATFKQEVALRNHSTIHSSICKYNCSYCEKSFKWKHSFKKHEILCKTVVS